MGRLILNALYGDHVHSPYVGLWTLEYRYNYESQSIYKESKNVYRDIQTDWIIRGISNRIIDYIPVSVGVGLPTILYG
jgi:hypothetical protein